MTQRMAKKCGYTYEVPGAEPPTQVTCSNVIIWQGIVLGTWKHEDAALDLDHPALFIQPVPRACCGGE